MKLWRRWNGLGIAVSFMIVIDGASQVSKAGFVATAGSNLRSASQPGGDALEGLGSRIGLDAEPESLSRPSSIFGSISTTIEPNGPGLTMETLVAQLGLELSADVGHVASLNDQDFQTVATGPSANGTSLDRSRGIWGRHLTHGNQQADSNASTLDTPPSVVLVGCGLVVLTLLRRRY